jgi:hypothetical protein
MTLSPTTKVIRVKSRGKKPLVLGKKLPTGWEGAILGVRIDFLLLCSVHLLRVGDKFRVFY